MLHTKNQKGEFIIAVGQEGSFARIKTEFDITIPKLIEKLWSYWYQGGINRHTPHYELENICEDDEVAKEMWSKLINTAYYYFTEELKKANEKV